MTRKRKIKQYYLSASLICSDFHHLKKEISLLEKGGIDYVHFDVMDGVFVPRYGLFPEMVKTVRKLSKLPIDIHLMVDNPEPYIDDFVKAGANIITVHPENNPHLHRTISMIKDSGAKAGIVFNPSTTLDSVKYLIDDIDLILIMAINPGIVGHKLIKPMLNKISEARELTKEKNGFLIEVDGGVNFRSAPQMLRRGANMLVCGSSTIYKKKRPLDQKIKELKKLLDKV